MHTDLIKARDNLRNKLLIKAELVLQEVLNSDIDDLIEVGLFGSLAKDKFSCNSDADIYLLFDNEIPDRITKGFLRSIAEENNCDIVFLKKSNFINDKDDLLVRNILDDRIILWRRDDYDKK